MSNNHPVKPEAARSWVVEYRQGMPTLVPSSWEVGYTPAHLATAMEAVQFEIDKLYAEIEKTRQHILKLSEFFPPEKPWCTECDGPYTTYTWLMEDHGGHWDTCPNRPKGVDLSHEVEYLDDPEPHVSGREDERNEQP